MILKELFIKGWEILDERQKDCSRRILFKIKVLVSISFTGEI